MFFSYLQPKMTVPSSWNVCLRPILYLLVATLAPLSMSQAQPASSSSDDLHKSLLNAERAIMEGLSAQAIGAAPVVPVKASITHSSAKPASPSSAVQPSKQAPKPAPVVKKAAPPASTVKPVRAPELPRTSSEGDIKAAALSRENDSLRKQLADLQRQVSSLESDLQESRSQLTVAETETNRLSTMVDAKTRASLGRYNVPMPPAAQPRPQPAAPQVAAPIAKPIGDVKPPNRNAEMQIATVTVDKADLRAGPGKNNSALMSLRRGSRLAVEERQGEWYRVFAPNGERAWVHSSLVSFGGGASNLNDGSAVRVKGYSANAEEEAFRRLQKMSSGK